jgi:DNA ligase-1
MRIGATMGTMLPALAQAVVFHRSLPSDLPVDKAQASLKAKLQEAASAVVEAYNFLPNLDLLVPMLISEGTESLASTVRVSLGTPIKPMLAKYVPLSHHLLSVCILYLSLPCCTSPFRGLTY